MRSTITVIFTVLLTVVYGQGDEFKFLLDRAKVLFREEQNLTQEELDKFDYHKIVSLLEKAIELNPQSAEARYFLGYTFSRINSSDGRGLIDMNLDLLYKTSEQFEKVIEISPKYSDEIIALDPYSKLSSEWGSMAMSYWHNNKADSAKWAFIEGKKRGGFGNFTLELNRKVLDACSKNSILISSGDNFSIPLWYLQIVENYRKDVAVVDVSLLNTLWYPTFLSQSNSVSFDFPKEVLDTVGYTIWKDSVITIDNFSWTLKPSYYNYYLLRGDRVLLSMLKANKFHREVFFTIGFMEEYRLSLRNYITPLVFVDKLTVFGNTYLTEKKYSQTIESALKLSSQHNRNSQDEGRMLDNFRYEILKKITNYLEMGEKEKATKLLMLLDKSVDENKYPYQDPRGKIYADNIRQKMQKNE